MSASTETPPVVREWLSEQGKKNLGKRCPGRRRGDSEYYRKLAFMRYEKERKQKESRKQIQDEPPAL
jgi:hypothetical protein